MIEYYIVNMVIELWLNIILLIDVIGWINIISFMFLMDI